MDSFSDYQAIAGQLPASLRNNRDRLIFPALGLQEDAGKIGSLLAKATASGKLDLTSGQKEALKDRLADMLWYMAILCGETGLTLQDVAAHSSARIQVRAGGQDPDRR